MRRRKLLWFGGGMVGVAGIAWWQRNAITRAVLTGRPNRNPQANVPLSTAPSPEDATCLLTAEQIEGLFYFPGPARSDIREDRAGLPLTLHMQVVRGDACRPVAGAVVQVWHCDAAGAYSGYPANLARKPFDTLRFIGGPNSHVEPVREGSYLRGAQVTGRDGMVEFRTILPGWYEPRVPHVHAKVFVGETSYLTTQLYFPDAFVREIYANHPDYAPHGLPPYTLRNDAVVGMGARGDGLLLGPVRQGDGLVAKCRLGIA